MGAFVVTEIDAVSRAGNPGQQRLDERNVLADQREHRPVVILVGMHVEDVGVRAESGLERGDRRRVPALGEIRHRFERKVHSAYSKKSEDLLRPAGVRVRRLVARAGPLRGEGAPRLGRGGRPACRGDRESAPLRTLDVACGTGFLTRHLQGDVVGLDASERMLAEARKQVPGATFVEGDALSLPFEDGRFDRIFTSYFYCHLEPEERGRFLSEARRVASELVVVASIRGAGDEAERWEERRLKDGSLWTVYKRVFEGEDLAEELGGELVFKGDWFIIARA